MRSLITLALALAMATPATAFDLVRQMRVTPLGGSDFVVEYESLARLSDYWCAAGNHVTNTLAMPDRTRVFRASPEPRKAGQGITFTLDPARSSGSTGLTTFGGPQDGSFSAVGAYAQFCIPFDDF